MPKVAPPKKPTARTSQARKPAAAATATAAAAARRRAGGPHPGRDAAVKQTGSASAVLVGLAILSATVIGVAAWMGQSLDVVENRMTAVLDGAASAAGLSVRSVRVSNTLSAGLRERVLDAADVRPGDNMFRASPKAIRARVETIPALADVQVYRLWPGYIQISATSGQAAMRWQKDGKIHIVDAQGEAAVEPIPAELAARLPFVVGEGGAVPSADLFAELKAWPQLSSRVKSVIRVGDRRWDIRFDTGTDVQLPEDDQGRSLAVARLYDLQTRHAILDTGLAKIDMRDPRRVYLRPFADELAAADRFRGG